jgi:RNA polymerase sigma-70 factor, ECF subfamily
MPQPDLIPELLLAHARDGDETALGRLLELYRNYLRLVARALIGQALRVRLDASDLVQ